MQSFWILPLAVQIMYSYAATSAAKPNHIKLRPGDKLSIMLPTGAVKLEFDSQKLQKDVLWTGFSPTKKGKIIVKDQTRQFVIYSVTYDDGGIYTVLNNQSEKISIHSVKIVGMWRAKGFVSGETCRIPLPGLAKDEATLQFTNQYFNLILVDHGSPVGNSNPDYSGRIQVTTNSIELLNVSASDVGNYTLKDRLNRPVLVYFMYLVDHHTMVNRNPLLALLLLLVIALGVYCWCRKKICKKTSQPTNTTSVNDDNQMNPSGPPTVCIPPAGTTVAYTPGYLAVGEGAVYPPPNPTFPPQPPCSGYPATSPAMPPNPAFNPGYPPASGFPPAQPPQWSGAPYNQPAPADFAPVMYNVPPAPEPVRGEINPTTPLLTPPQPEVAQPPAPYAGANVFNSSDSSVQFNVNMGKDSSSNFL